MLGLVVFPVGRLLNLYSWLVVSYWFSVVCQQYAVVKHTVRLSLIARSKDLQSCNSKSHYASSVTCSTPSIGEKNLIAEFGFTRMSSLSFSKIK